MKIVKISNDHYIVVDDSEIEIGDLYYLPRTNSVHNCIEDPTELNLERHSGTAKVTHSTEPLELLSENGLSGMGFSKVRPLNVFEEKIIIINKEQAIFYESAKTSLVMSFVYLWFPKYFTWVCNKRYKRYTKILIQGGRGKEH